MVTARNLAIVAAAALAGMPWSKAQACDNDRFPCPIVSEAPVQDSADAAPAAPPQQSKKKPTQAVQQREKPASAKGESDIAQTASRPPSKQSGQDNAKRAARPGKSAPHEQANAAGAPPAPAVQVASPVPVISEQLHNAATVRADSAPVPTRDASGNAEGAGGTPGTPSFNAQQIAAAGDFKLAERNEVDLTAAAESSWLAYLLVLLGGALAAATTVRLFRSNGANVLLARLHDRLGRISASR
jgi:hypothetical protein